MDKGSFLIAGDDFRRGFAIQIADEDLRADAGVGVDLMGDKLGRAAGATPFYFIPIENGGVVYSRVAPGAVRLWRVGPITFAGDDVLDAVAIDICQIYGVGLTE